MEEQDIVERLTFYPDEDILEIDLHGLTFKTAREADLFHDVLDRRITETGRTWYFLSRFEDCTIEPGAALQFSIRRAHAHDWSSRGAVRYGASGQTDRAMMSVKSDPKTALNVFDNRDQAMARINEMKAAV